MIRFLTLILVFCNFSLIAQMASLSGVVTDQSSGEPLISANVKIGVTYGTSTDFEGNFNLAIAAGTYELEVSYLGYETYTQKITLAENEEKTLTISLAEVTNILQTATVTSGKFEKPLSEVTVSLEVLKPSLLESNNTVDISTVLTKVPGVSVIDGQANIRGGSGYSYGAGSRVLLLVDDIPILTADAGFPNWRDLPTENIEQIEVVKGASSALYGSAALNGIINVRTAYAKAEPETKIATFGTAYLKPKDRSQAWWNTPPSEFGASVMHRRKINKFDLVVGGLYSNEHSFIQDERPGVDIDQKFRRYGRVNANVRYRITDRLNVGVSTNFNQGKSKDFFFWKGIDNLYVGDTTTLSVGTQTRINIDPTITYFDQAGNRFKFLGRVYNVNNEFNADQSNGSLMTYAEAQYQRNWEDIQLVSTAGLVRQTATTEAELYGGNEYTAQNLGAYLQLDKKFGDRLNVSTGFRFEQNQIENPAFFNSSASEEVPAAKDRESKPVFRFGLNYKATEFTFIRASWGQGYRFPTLAEKFISTNIGGIAAAPNPDLNSETGWSLELGVKQGFKISEFLGFIDVSVFQSEYQDMMEFNTTFFPSSFVIAFQSKNVGDTRIRGLEVTVAGNGTLFGLPTTLLSGYNFIDPRFQEFDLAGKDLNLVTVETAPQAQVNAYNSSVDYNILKYRFQHSATLDIESKIQKLSIGIGASYNSHMDAIDALIEFDERVVPNADDFRSQNDNGFFLLGIRTAYQFNSNFKLSLLMNNVLNTAYSLRVGVMNAPRNVGMRLDMKF